MVSSLSLRSAIERVLTFSPALKAAFMEVQARHGDEVQAGVRPNPELRLDVEDFLGSGDKSGFRSSEETLSITQLVELGDKRVTRLRAASLDTTLASWDLEAARFEAVLHAAAIYVDVLASQERLDVLNKSLDVSERTKGAVAKRIKVGNTNPVELDRANVNAARARAALKSEQARYDATRRHLSSLWGSSQIDFERAAGRLGNGTTVPAADRILAYIGDNPTVARWSDEIGRRVAQLDLEQSKSARDYTLGAGVRHSAASDSVAFVVSVTTPLKIYDTNAGAITAAEQRIAKAEFEKQAARQSATGIIAEKMSELSAAAAQVRSLEREVLPAAESAFDKLKSGYEEARFDLVSLLDAQRTLFEVRLELVNAKAEFERAKVQIEALIGRKLTEI